MRVQLLLMVILFSTHSFSASFDFIDEDFDAFVQRVVLNKEDIEPFKSYYTRLMEKLEHNEENKRITTHRYLIRLALAELRTHKVDWYNTVEPYVVDEHKARNIALRDKRMQVSKFLIRYGAYEEFKSLAQVTPLMVVHKNKPEPKPIQKPMFVTSWWHTAKNSVKSFFSSVSNKVADLFA